MAPGLLKFISVPFCDTKATDDYIVGIRGTETFVYHAGILHCVWYDSSRGSCWTRHDNYTMPEEPRSSVAWLKKYQKFPDTIQRLNQYRRTHFSLFICLFNRYLELSAGKVGS